MKVVVESRETEREGEQAMRSQKERGGEDEFRLLPDELLVLILNKVTEAKWLCRCSTVSKRFASVVFHTHTISIKMPQFQKRILGPEETPILQQKASLHLLSEFLDPFKGVFKFLSNFREIHSLNIDFPAYGELGQEDMFKWEAYFGTELESFTIVLSSSICKMMNPLEVEEEEEQQEEEPGSEIRMDLWIQRVRQAFECLNDAFLRHLILLFMVAQVKSIQSAAIMDSRNGVKLYVGNKQLSHLTDLVNETTIVPLMELAERLPKCLKVCHLPELRLPLCGYVMKRAMVVIMEQVDEKKEIDNDTGYVHGVIGGGFEGVEKAFEEAVTEMLMNHGDKMQTINFP